MLGWNDVTKKKKDFTKDVVSKVLSTNSFGGLGLGSTGGLGLGSGLGLGGWGNLDVGKLKGNSLNNVWDGFNVFNKLKTDAGSKDSMLRFVGEERKGKHGKLHYKTPEGRNVFFETSNKVKFSHLPTLDDVGYLLDMMPKGIIPSDVNVRVVSRRHDRDIKPAAMWTAGHYDDTKKEIRLYPYRQDPHDQDWIEKYSAKTGKTRAQSTDALIAYRNKYPEQYKSAKADYNSRVKSQEFNRARGILMHELGHAVDYKRGLQEKWEKQGLNRKESITKYGRKSPAEDFADSFVFWSGVPNVLPGGYKEKYSLDRDRPWDERYQERAKFFDTHVSDINPREVVNVREVFESVQPEEFDEYAAERQHSEIPQKLRKYPEENIYRTEITHVPGEKDEDDEEEYEDVAPEDFKI